MNTEQRERLPLELTSAQLCFLPLCVFFHPSSDAWLRWLICCRIKNCTKPSQRELFLPSFLPPARSSRNHENNSCLKLEELWSTFSNNSRHAGWFNKVGQRKSLSERRIRVIKDVCIASECVINHRRAEAKTRKKLVTSKSFWLMFCCFFVSSLRPIYSS